MLSGFGKMMSRFIRPLQLPLYIVLAVKINLIIKTNYIEFSIGSGDCVIRADQ